jgi:hypothetical protein
MANLLIKQLFIPFKWSFFKKNNYIANVKIEDNLIPLLPICKSVI